MAQNGFLTPAELSKTFVSISEKKASLSLSKTLVLGVLAGVYIGFAANLATTVATGDCAYFGFKKFLIGAVFSVGLMLVVIPGSELFTGNNLIMVGLCSKRIGGKALLRNWVIVYLGNFLGSLLLAFLIVKGSGLLVGEVGGTAIKIAYGKVNPAEIGGMSHNMAFFCRGICCNWLVCLAVMIGVSAKDISGKVWGIFFPIMAFVASGFEHSIANMYFIPAGIFAKGFSAAVQASGLSPDQLASLTWGAMFKQNLIAVTLGNIAGGAIFVSMVYYWLYVCGSDVCQRGKS